MKLLSNEEIHQLTSEWKSGDHTVSGEWESFIRYCAKAQARLTLKEVGEWLNNSIMRTDNRVAKLWVLGDVVKSLLKGQMPEN